MTITITGAKALKTLPLTIDAEHQRLNHMTQAYEDSKSASGFTQKDIHRQIGFIQGLKEAMLHILQQEWCDKNDHPVPATTLGDIERYLDLNHAE